MKHISRHRGILNITQRLPNSANGNPRFALFIADESGTGVSCVTAPDSAYAYDIQNLEGKHVTITIGTHYGRATLNSVEAWYAAAKAVRS